MFLSVCYVIKCKVIWNVISRTFFQSSDIPTMTDDDSIQSIEDNWNDNVSCWGEKSYSSAMIVSTLTVF